MCQCEEEVILFHPELTGSTISCQAYDMIQDKFYACAYMCDRGSELNFRRAEKDQQIVRLCSNHLRLMSKHFCCPSCSIFCISGKFRRCSRSSTHIYHSDCAVTNAMGEFICPHCKKLSAHLKVILKVAEARAGEEDRKEKQNARISLTGGGKDSGKPEPVYDHQMIADSDIIELAAGLLSGKEQKKIGIAKKKALDMGGRFSLQKMHKAIQADNINMVYTMSYYGHFDQKQATKTNGETALHFACKYGRPAAALILLKCNAVSESEDESGLTPFLQSAKSGNMECAKLLAKLGTNTTARDKKEMTCLHHAAETCNADSIQELFRICRPDPNVQDEHGWSPMMWAIDQENEDDAYHVVATMLSAGANADMRDSDGNSSLHWAVSEGRLKLTGLILNSRHCQIDGQNNVGDTALHIACRRGFSEIADCLALKLASTRIRNLDDEYPLDCWTVDNDPPLYLDLSEASERAFGIDACRINQVYHHRDISRGKEAFPVVLWNKVDYTPPPTDFTYVTDYVKTSLVIVNNMVNGLMSCDCKHSSCSSPDCNCVWTTGRCWYDENGRLKDEFFQFKADPPSIYECNLMCECWQNCQNRVVQKGPRCSALYVFRTDSRGWGVKSKADIMKGTFVCEYIGELISDAEADRRDDDSYLFDLEYRGKDTYAVDARLFGNISRFINHSCEPNLFSVRVFVDHQDMRFPRICLFASRYIVAGQELGLDYGERFWSVKYQDFLCSCGTNSCRYSTDTIQQTLEDIEVRMGFQE